MGDITTDNENFNIYRDAISQFPILDGYTHMLRVFEISQDASRDFLAANIQKAFDEVKVKIPWLDGQVAAVDGVMQSVPWPLDAPANSVLRRDADDVLPSFAEIMAADGPVSMFPGEHIVPWPGLPAPHGITRYPVPVAVLSAVFIKGGLLLLTSLHHHIMDGTALLTLWDLLAAVMNGEPDPIPNETVAQANRDRTRVIPLLRPGEPTKDYSHLLRPDDFIFPPMQPTVCWCVFHVPLATIPRIKALAGDQNSPGWDPAVAYISNNDALSAFAWQRISAVRLAHGRRDEQISKFSRAVDLRGALSIPNSYMGHMVGFAATHLPLGEVATAPLARLACALRRDLAEADTEWAARSFATFVARTEKKRLLYGGVYNPFLNVGASSMFSMDRAHRPFRMGVLGKSRMFRKPDVALIPGCVYFLPSDNERDLQLVLCMPKEELAALVADTKWSKYIKCVDVEWVVGTCTTSTA